MRFSFLIIIGYLFTLTSCVEDSKSGLSRKDNSTFTTLTPELEIASQIHRNRGSAVLSYKEEIDQTLANTLPVISYRTVPDMTMDHESSGDTITQLAYRDTYVPCGIDSSFINITQRMANCELLNSKRTTTWSGFSNGTSGEGTWKLVARDASKNEIWLDTRTGMVWSDLITVDTKTTFNWCQAANNNQGETSITLIDCQDLNQNVNVCINNATIGIGPQIEWRLPTRNDFLQADINGSRYVLKPSSTGLWTATMKSNITGNTQAWVYQTADGTLTPTVLTELRNVRCIGAPKI